MLVQKKYLPYDSSRFFADGRTMRAPPEGTVPRERAVEPAAASATAIPFAVTPEVIATGRGRFDIYCAVCHGERADGQSVVALNMADCPPPSLISDRVRAFPPGAVYTIITYGFGRMPPYAPELPPHDRWAVIAYLRTLQQRAPASTLPGLVPLASDTTPRRNTTGCGRPLLTAGAQQP
jgi:mono/diheme cytochrome c family protein